MKKPIPGRQPSAAASRRIKSVPRPGRNRLSHREVILEAVSFAAEKFLKAASWESNIKEVIRRLGRAADVSRVYIFKKHLSPQGSPLISQVYEWAAPGVAPQIGNPSLQSMSLEASGFSRWLRVLSQGRPVYGHTRNFPRGERGLLEQQAVKSIIVVPVFAQKQAWGFMGFDECRRERRWSAAGIDALKAAASILGGAIENEGVRTSLASSERELRGLFENMIEGVYQTTPDGRILAANPALVRLLGYDSLEELRAVKAEEFYASPQQREAWVERIARHGEIRNFESRFKRKDGSLIVVQDNARVIRDAQGRVLCYEGTLTDITDRKRLEDQLHWLANRDSLTNLFNRRRFHEELQHHLHQTQRYQNPLALLWLDVDRFKDINDRLGHRAGDELLIEIALLLQDQVRKADLLARLGGDEFAILMPHSDLPSAESAAARILGTIRERTFRLEEQPVRITASIGIALYPEHGHSADKLLGHADLAMYRAKEQGRDRSSLETSSKLRTEFQEYRAAWAWLAERAFDEKRFLLYAQPIFDLGRGTISQYELLPRWITDSGLVVSAESFLNVGHQFTLAKEIDHWMFRQAVELLRQQKSGPKKVLEFSLSCGSFVDRELAALFERERATLDPSFLVVDVSELAMVSEFPRAQEFIGFLKNLGYRCALADFGAGLTSLQHLRLLNLDFLKIDNSLVQDLPGHRFHRDLFKAIVQLAHSLGLQTMADGVDEEKTLDLLRELEVDLAQGYHLGLPQPLDKVFS